MKKLFTLLAAVLLTLQMNAQLMDNSFSVIYDTFGAFQLEVIANFNCGSVLFAHILILFLKQSVMILYL